MRFLRDLSVSGKKVFVRGDLDVPLANSNDQTPNSKLGLAEQATRLTNLAPTVDWLIDHGARQIIIAGHINRPQKPDPVLSTKQLLEPLQKLLGTKISFIPDLSSYFKPGLKQVDKQGDSIASLQNDMKVMLLENLRFWPGETANDPEFAKKLAALADVYVNEAFGNCHRAHASMVSLPQLLPHAAGLHLEKEVEVLSKLLKNPARPFVAIVGGVKIETKVPVIENLAKVADFVLVGGEIAKQLTIDNLQLTTDQKDRSNVKGQMSKVIVATLTPDGKDISGESIYQFQTEIAKAKTIVWNGPMGVFEEGFDKGTKSIAQAIIESGVYSVVGGGETTQFLGKLGMLAKFGFISSGGGAMLEFLAGKELPGLAALA